MLQPYYYYYSACAFVALHVFAATQLHTHSASNGPTARWHLTLANVDQRESLGLKEQRPRLVPLIDPLVLVLYKCVNIAAMLALYIHVCQCSENALDCNYCTHGFTRPRPVASAL